MNDILNFIDHTIQQEEKFLPKFPEGTSQHSLLRNRIQALQTARDLISGKRKPSWEELEFALPRIESMIHKMSKARDKYEPGSRNYKRFVPRCRLWNRFGRRFCRYWRDESSGLRK